MEKLKPGFIWTVKEYDQHNNLVAEETTHNLIPIEGLNYILGASFDGATQYTNLFVGLTEGNYTPVPADTMATFPTVATELTAYTSATRPALVLGAIAAGNVDNLDAITEFTGTTDGKQALGGFITTAAAKGGTTGPLLSAIKFPSPRSLNNGGRLEVAVAFQFVSV